MPKKVFKVMYAINYILQAAFCMIVPAGLIILGGWLLVNRCGAGRWVMIVTIVAGVLLGLYSMFYFLLKTVHTFDPTDQNAKGGDRHDGKT